MDARTLASFRSLPSVRFNVDKALDAIPKICTSLYTMVTPSRFIWSRLLHEAMDAAHYATNSVNAPDLLLQRVREYTLCSSCLELLARTSEPTRSQLTSLRAAAFKLASNDEELIRETYKILYLQLLPSGRWLLGRMAYNNSYAVCS